MAATLKDPELQAYYDDVFAMYGSPGWKRLMKDMEDLATTLDSTRGLETAEQLWHRKGQLDIIARMTTHQTIMEQGYREDLIEQEGKDIEPGTSGKAQVVSPGTTPDPFE